MAYPVVEQIAQKLFGRLELVTVANGYDYDATVKRPTRFGGWKALDKEIVMVQGEESMDEENTTVGNPVSVARWQEFQVGVVAINSEFDTDPVETIANCRAAQVMVAIATPEDAGEDWVKWDGLAIDTDWLPMTDFIDQGGSIVGQVIHINVLYRTPENDPYTVV